MLANSSRNIYISNNTEGILYNTSYTFITQIYYNRKNQAILINLK